MPPYFNANGLPVPQSEFVAWVDVMGIQATMNRSVPVAANFMGKLQVQALESRIPGMTLYPVMDGFYVTTADSASMRQFLCSVFAGMANMFMAEQKQHFRCLIRGAVSFGSVYHGGGIADAASPTLAANAAYRSLLLFGQPMIAANAGERLAPAFGLYVDQFARHGSFADVSDDGFCHWALDLAPRFDRAACLQSLETYYSHCERSPGMGYAADRLAVHRQTVRQYFT